MVSKDDCWLWAGNILNTGYGCFWGENRVNSAHRTMYESVKGKIPDGLEIDHLCMVKHCVNPDHLEAVTRAENLRRQKIFYWGSPVKLICKNGHPLAGDNLRTYIKDKATGRIGRQCKKCQNDGSMRRYYLKKQLKNKEIR